MVVVFMIASFTTNAQETFTRTYNYLVKVNKNVTEETSKSSLKVVFYPKGKEIIKLYFDDGDIITVIPIGDIAEGKTEGGEEFQAFNVMEDKTGNEIRIQLFDKINAFRINLGNDYFLEYHK